MRCLVAHTEPSVPRKPISGNLKYLIIETVAAKPHLETAGEIALARLEEGYEVVFAFLGRDLPWIDCDLPSWLKWVGCSMDKRVVQFERIIADRGVAVRSVPALPDHVQKSCRVYADQFSGGLDELRQYRYANVPLGLGCASSLISWSQDNQFDPAAYRQTTRAALLAAALTYERAIFLIRTEKPDSVVTFNGRFATCRPIVEAAATEGVPLLRHERGATNTKYDLFKESVHSYDYIRNRIEIAWQKADPTEREKDGHEYFVRRRNGDDFGWYSVVNRQKRGKIRPWTLGKIKILYFSSNDDEFAAVSDTIAPGYWGTQFKALTSLIRVCEGIDHVELFVRLHPYLTTKSWAERDRWHTLCGKNVITIPEETDIDTYAQLESADVVVSYGSTIGIEATYWCKPSILMGPAQYAGTGVCMEPQSIAELSQLLRNAKELVASPRARCLPYGNYHLNRGTLFRFYKPESKFEGTFLGDRLSLYSFPIEALRRYGGARRYREIREKVEERLYAHLKNFQ